MFTLVCEEMMFLLLGGGREGNATNFGHALLFCGPPPKGNSTHKGSLTPEQYNPF